MAIRIGGLASGMDIDTMVKDLMKAERMPLNKLSQKKQILEWQRDDFREMNKLMDKFDQFIFKETGMQSTFTKKKVTSTDETAVTATGSGAAANFTSTISVTTLAKPNQWISGGATLADGITKPAGTAKLNELDASLPATFDITVKVQKPGSTVYEAPVKISVNSATDTIDSLAAKLNSAGLQVSAFYDASSGKFAISNNNTGTGSNISLENADTIKVFSKLGFSSPVLNGSGGEDAKFSLNGVSNMTSKSNTVTISGVTYSLKKEGVSATITSNTDTTAIFDSVVKFVDEYNKMVEGVKGKLTEERFRSYQPLSTEERKELSEKEAELWDKKAKSGLIKGDSILSSGLQQLRSKMYEKVPTGFVGFEQLTSFGITTTNADRSTGKLTIKDEAKLKQAIETNPEAVMSFFTGIPAKDGVPEVDGMVDKLRKSIKDTLEKMEKKAGTALLNNSQFTIGKELLNVDKSINAFEDRLRRTEDRYWRQFTAMEKAIQQSNQQSTYLMQQFSGGQ
ncbi:flagellar hook-associated protein 2 [Fictibacillus iocasae]|uniref:Flagellar hook-associated protein 2 n=1 Tax=Fictibacillus iocasae TaxID=2715437 RepID=A0ABW2NYB6_9BACL